MKLFYFFKNSKRKLLSGGNWGITRSENKARKLDINYRLATLEDVNDLICATGKIFKSIIEIKEGLFIWRETTSYDRLGYKDVIGDYHCLIAKVDRGI